MGIRSIYSCSGSQCLTSKFNTSKFFRALTGFPLSTAIPDLQYQIQTLSIEYYNTINATRRGRLWKGIVSNSFPRQTSIENYISRPLHYCTVANMADSQQQAGSVLLANPMPASYEPEYVESRWMEWWERQGYFSPSGNVKNSSGGKFVMVIPPPNVTGSLHIGHALTVAIEDSLTRWNRMSGRSTLWVPGVDHAGIATQSVVERMLMKEESVTRHDLGREEFIKRVWEWREKYGGKIDGQLRRVGASVSWPHYSFTLDEPRSKAVTEAFVRLFDRGLIYRAKRLVSWSSTLKTAISDIEVDVEEIDRPQKIKVPGYDRMVEVGYLWHFVYPIEGGEEIEVATTRIETMLGDTAVAVNPQDKRYQHLIGKRVLHPFFPNRDVRVIGDDYVDMEFGTGAVKITPAHDKNDYEIGLRHNLDFITILTLDGKISEEGGEFAGQHRWECRYSVQEKLSQLGLLREKVANEKPMQLPRCSRSGDIIEYLLIDQWWMNCDAAAKRGVEAVRKGDMIIKPDYYVASWEHWLNGIRHWCISRQLWWGHRIPAYRVVEPKIPSPDNSDIWVAARSDEEAISIARQRYSIPDNQNVIVEQDPDVLDTWFSSSLFPFSVLGWPDKTKDLETFFPTSLLETGHDILFFWVARMVMMSLELLDQLPFKTVFLHPMVRDSQGQKMSKSKGNVIDPLEVIEGISVDQLIKKLHEGNLQEKEIKRSEALIKSEFKEGIPACGCDALRMGLLAYMRQGRNINLDLNRVVGYRHFANKIWNCTKFALEKFALSADNESTFKPRSVVMGSNVGSTKDCVSYHELEWVDKWILHKLALACDMANKGFESYEFADVVTAVYNFWLYELCDVYLESIKSRMVQNSTDQAAIENMKKAQDVLYICVERGLRLLHPICPFVTEELFQRLPDNPSKLPSIVISSYPLPPLSWIDVTLDNDMAMVQQITGRFRSLMSALEIPNKSKPKGFIMVTEDQNQRLHNFLLDKTSLISNLAKMDVISLTSTEPAKSACDVVSSALTIYLELAENVNIAQTLEKLEKKKKTMEKTLEGYCKKEQDPNYLERVPESVRLAQTEKKESLVKQLELLSAAIDNLALLAK